MGFQMDWNVAAPAWAQAIANTVVLFMIYLQIRQTNVQLIQSDEQEKFRRSWEFVKLYRDELREDEVRLVPFRESFNPLTSQVTDEAFAAFIKHYFNPRFNLFLLLNQLVQHQEVDERILFGYLEDDFNRFVELGIRQYGAEEFKRTIGARMKILLAHWGSQIKSGKLLYEAK